MNVLFNIGAGNWNGFYFSCEIMIKTLLDAGHQLIVAASHPEAVSCFSGNPLYKTIDLHRCLTSPATLAVNLMTAGIPDYFIIYNGLRPESLLLQRAADILGAPRAYIEKGLLPNTFQLDTHGVNGFSSFARDSVTRKLTGKQTAKLQEFRKIYLHGGATGWTQLSARIGPEALKHRLAVPDDAIVILYIGQVNEDSNITHLSPYFKSNLDVIALLLPVLKNNRRFFLIGKKHPFGNDDDASIRQMIDKHGYWGCDLHLHDCIELADAVVSINSSVILDALLFEKPLAILGESIFSGKKLAFEFSGNPRDLEYFLQVRPQSDSSRTDYWLYRLIFDYLYTCDSLNAGIKILETLESFNPPALSVKQQRLDIMKQFFNMRNTQPTHLSTSGSMREIMLLEKYITFRWPSLRRENNLKKIALYGAGKHTQWLLSVVERLTCGPEITSIWDDHAACSSINGITVLPVQEQASIRDVDAVVLSSDVFQAQMKASLKNTWTTGGPKIIDLYEGLPPGPYEKRYSILPVQNR